MMKPTQVREVLDIEMDPSELWCKLGMLVIESRQPDESVKGWREGPHCSLKNDQSNHSCAPHTNTMCKRKESISREIRSLGRNNVPVCIEVVLLPNCDIHDHKTDLSHGVIRGQYLLLEQWKFRVIPKRSSGSSIGISSLCQVVKSYLHFSQLSAWLNQSKGTAPKSVEYRVSPPAEFCTSTFKEPPVLHRFPICSQQYYKIQVTVAALPRQKNLVEIICPYNESAHAPVSDKQEGSDDRKQTKREARQEEDNGYHVSERRQLSVLNRATDSQPQTSRMVSPDMDARLGACAMPVSVKDGLGYNVKPKQRSESPCGATCANYALFPSEPGGGDGGPPGRGFQDYSGGGLATVQPIYEHREPPMRRSKTFKDSHVYNDDSSDCSESSTVMALSQNSSDDQLAFKNKRSMHSSASMQSFREQTTSPKFYLPCFIKPPRESISSPSSSDSSQYGVKDSLFSPPHRPSPPIDLNIPSISSIDSLSRKVITKLHLEPLPAFELGAQVNNSVQDEPQNYSQCKSVCDKAIQFYHRTNTAQPPSHGSHPSEQYKYQNIKSERCIDLNFRQTKSDKKKQNQCKEDNDDMLICSNCTNNTSHLESRNNGSILPLNSSHTPHSHIVSSPVSNGTSGVGAKETNGFHIEELEEGLSNQFLVPKTPDKPLKTILSRHLQDVQTNQAAANAARAVPSAEDKASFRQALMSSAAKVFNKSSGLPLQSSPLSLAVFDVVPTSASLCTRDDIARVISLVSRVPGPPNFIIGWFSGTAKFLAPIKRLGRMSFGFDENLTCAKAIKNSLSCANLDGYQDDASVRTRKQRYYSTSAPASTNSLLGNFEESLLNGRIEPCGAVDGFSVEIGASGSFCPSHVTLPCTAFFFQLSDDNAPSPYLGHVGLESVGRRGYHIPSKGTIQVTLFNPNKTVVKMFVVRYDLSDMPSSCTTFLRQRTLYTPVPGSSSDTEDAPQYLRYLIHLRVASTKSRKLYLHSDIRLIFARDKFEYDSRIANYEYRSLTEGPVNPKYSPKK